MMETKIPTLSDSSAFYIKRACGIFIMLLFGCIIPILINSADAYAARPSDQEVKAFFDALDRKCAEYGWKDIAPRKLKWEFHRSTAHKNPLIFMQFGNSDKNCILFLGSVHGDELPTVYLMLKLAHHLETHPALIRDKCIVIAPLVNPDGFLSKPPRRVNAAGIDINRNFPTKDWNRDALRLWKQKAHSNRRYFPGRKPGSEQETQFQVALIKRYRPQKIMSLHSPLNFYDFDDGPSTDLYSVEKWLDMISKETNHPFKKYGFFPGSLGNYAGHERNIFTLTLELPTSNPRLGGHYFEKFQSVFLRFLNLSVNKAR